MERAVAALIPFVQEWHLPLNPENLHEIAWAVLVHADGDQTFEEIQAAVRAQLAEAAALWEGLYRDDPGAASS